LRYLYTNAPPLTSVLFMKNADKTFLLLTFLSYVILYTVIALVS